jgi:hypothetical protein
MDVLRAKKYPNLISILILSISLMMPTVSGSKHRKIKSSLKTTYF